MIVDYALIDNDVIVNVAVFDDADSDTLAHFRTLYDEVVPIDSVPFTPNPDAVTAGIPLSSPRAQKGWGRSGAGQPFLIPTPIVLADQSFSVQRNRTVSINKQQGIAKLCPGCPITTITIFKDTGLGGGYDAPMVPLTLGTYTAGGDTNGPDGRFSFTAGNTAGTEIAIVRVEDAHGGWGFCRVTVTVT